PDLVLMDVGLPDTDGREVVRSLRKGGFKAPIIMLTGHDTDSDTILGLESGANDYVTKPFRFAVLLARIRAQLRSHETSEDAVFRIGPYEFRPAAKMLIDGDSNKIRPTEKATAIPTYPHSTLHNTDIAPDPRAAAVTCAPRPRAPPSVGDDTGIRPRSRLRRGRGRWGGPIRGRRRGRAPRPCRGRGPRGAGRG